MRKLFLLITLALLPTATQAQLWSGVINSSRATDWTRAGFPGSTLPSASWTQCGSTLAAGTYTGASITATLAGCGANKFYLLGPGTFNITGQILYPAGGHIALRGSGANSTFVVVGATGGVTCQLHTSFICAQTSDVTYFNQPPPSATAWSAGYAQGSNQITVGSVTGISTTTPTMILLEQCETGYTAASATAACTGTATDNNQLFVCSDTYSAPNGCSQGAGNGNTHRGQFEMTYATSIAGSVVTIADPLIHPNWASGQAPRIWIQQPIVQVGIEDMAIDGAANGTQDLVQFFGAYQWWVSGCKFTNWAIWAVMEFQAEHGVVKDNYFYHDTTVDPYAVRLEGAGRNLVQNNIFQQVISSIVFDGPSSGDVIAYNFSVDQNLQVASGTTTFMKASFFEHAVNSYELYEGNVADQQVNDGDHGTANMITRHRNLFLGWASCANGQCGTATSFDGWTNAFQDVSKGSRYQNNTGNVLGTPGFHTIYQSTGASGWNGAVEVPGGSNTVPADLLSKSTSLFWGEYNVVTGAVRWCRDSSSTGWVAVCGSVSEIPTGASTYPNALPTLGDTGAGQGALPVSYYLSSKPSWFGAIAWPPIGPDVSSGNLGLCSGTLNVPGQFNGVPSLSNLICGSHGFTASAWGGHANAIPAMACALNVMGMPPDGTGPVLAFSAKLCYSGSTLAPPTNLKVIPLNKPGD